MGVLSRYEVTLERSLYKALHELQRLQAARDGQAVPLPVAVDVSVSDEGGRNGFDSAKTGPFQATLREMRSAIKRRGETWA